VCGNIQSVKFQEDDCILEFKSQTEAESVFAYNDFDIEDNNNRKYKVKVEIVKELD